MARDLSRFLQPPNTARAGGAGGCARPHRSGGVRTVRGEMGAVRCPAAFDELMRLKGGVREAGSRRWLIPRWRINPLMRELRRATDPLFRQAGIDLDG